MTERSAYPDAALTGPSSRQPRRRPRRKTTLAPEYRHGAISWSEELDIEDDLRRRGYAIPADGEPVQLTVAEAARVLLATMPAKCPSVDAGDPWANATSVTFLNLLQAAAQERTHEALAWATMRDMLAALATGGQR